MEGVTEGSYITAMSAGGWTKMWWTPFIRISTAIPRTVTLKRRVGPYLASGLPVIAQIMGTNSARLAGAARRLADIGATVIDLNCACPSRNVTSSHAGGFCLKNPGWISDTLMQIQEAVGQRCAIGVKLRIGYDSPHEFADIASAVKNASPDMVTVHFRTVKETYSAIPDGLKRMTMARGLLPDTFFVGCGDIFTADDARRMMDYAAVDGIAPARGLIKNPHLLVEISQAAAGKHPEELDESEKLAFLNAMRTEESKRCYGILLQSAVQMLPPDHPYITALKQML